MPHDSSVLIARLRETLMLRRDVMADKSATPVISCARAVASWATCSIARIVRVRGDDLGLWTASALGAKAVAAPPSR